VPESISRLLAAVKTSVANLLATPAAQSVGASIRTHKWWWAGGGGAFLAAVIAAIVVFGGFLGPSGKTVCTVGLQLAKDYGVISPSAELASTSAESTDVADRKQCSVQVGGDAYVVQADIKSEDSEHKSCRDYVKQSGCIMLYSVARTDGLTTYQVREIPPDETDEAIEAAEKQAAESGGAAPGGQAPGVAETDSGLIDTETAVDNTGGMQGGQGGDTGQAAPQQ
jgi:hypothetical protein